MTIDDKKINPDYYTKGIPTTEYIESHNLGFLAGQCIKYLTRYLQKHENPLEDLFKCQWYLDKLIEKHTPTPQKINPLTPTD
tara:strand:- start:216 stop:461 length:246 start_codon:yes stop_codon:yes gene_type:complete